MRAKSSGEVNILSRCGLRFLGVFPTSKRVYKSLKIQQHYLVLLGQHTKCETRCSSPIRFTVRWNKMEVERKAGSPNLHKIMSWKNCSFNVFCFHRNGDLYRGRNIGINRHLYG